MMSSKPDRRMETAAQILTAMANRNRLEILCLLAEGERSVSRLSATIGLAQSPLSQHLAKLRALDIVTTRRSGQSVLYSLRSDEVKRLLEVLNSLYHICPE